MPATLPDQLSDFVQTTGSVLCADTGSDGTHVLLARPGYALAEWCCSFVPASAWQPGQSIRALWEQCAQLACSGAKPEPAEENAPLLLVQALADPVFAAADPAGSPERSRAAFARMDCLKERLLTRPAASSWLCPAKADQPSGPWAHFVGDTETALLWSMLVDARVQARSHREGVTLVHVGNRTITAFLVYEDKVTGVYEHRTSRHSRESLVRDLGEFQRCFLPTEVVQAGGGAGTCYGPECEEADFVPTFVSGPGAALLEGHAMRLVPWYGADREAFAGCFGLLCCAARAGFAGR